LGDRHLGTAFAAPRLMFISEPAWQIVSLLADEYRNRSSIDGLYCQSIDTALCVELLRLGDAGNHTGDAWRPSAVADALRSQSDGREATEFAIASGVLIRMLELGRSADARLVTYDQVRLIAPKLPTPATKWGAHG
jgi:hypothetical protein